MLRLGCGHVQQHTLLDPETLLDSSPCLSHVAGVLVLQQGSEEPRKVPLVVVMGSYAERLGVLLALYKIMCLAAGRRE